jgi:hypothetical protein
MAEYSEWSERVRKWHARGDMQTLEHRKEYILYLDRSRFLRPLTLRHLLTPLPPCDNHPMRNRGARETSPEILAAEVYRLLREDKYHKIIIYLASPEDVAEDIDRVANFPRLEITKKTATLFEEQENPDESRLIRRIARFAKELVDDSREEEQQ